MRAILSGMPARLLAVAGLLATVGVGVAAQHDATAHAAPPPANASVFTPMVPQRLVDTRSGLGGIGGRFGFDESRAVQVTGKLGIPAGASAVTVNVTAVDSGGAGYVQVIPTGGAALRSSSTLNVDAIGQTIPNASFAPLNADGQLTVFTTFPTDILIDVSGYFTPSAQSAAGRLVPLTPTRILDTRINLGYTPPAPPPTTTPTTTPATTPPTTAPKPGNPGDTKNCTDFATYQEALAWFNTYFPYYGDVANLDSDHDGQPCETLPGHPNLYAPRNTEAVPAANIVRLQVAGFGGVPLSGVSAVVMNVTAVNPAGPGYVQVAPTPLTIGASSNLNTSAGRTIANLVVVPLGSGGAVDLYATVSADLLADVVGYFTDTTAQSSTSGLFVPITPNRQLDTREPAPQVPLSAGTVTLIDINDISTESIAIAGNLTATVATKDGYLQLAAAPVNPGTASNVNIAYNGQTIANAVVSPTASGLLDVYNAGPSHVLLDVTGWFTAG
jgi:hypothetical protein